MVRVKKTVTLAKATWLKKKKKRGKFEKMIKIIIIKSNKKYEIKNT